MTRRLFFFFLMGSLLPLLAAGHALAAVVVRSITVNVGAEGPSAGSTQINVNVPAGLQLFALPGEPVTPVPAWQLKEMLAAKGSTMNLLVRLNDQGVLEPYMQGFTPDFNLVPGHAYILNNARACTLTFRVKNNVALPAVPVRKGMNLLSVPGAGSFTGGQILQAMSAAGGGSPYIVRMQQGLFQLHCPSLPALGTQDFDIVGGQGFIVGSPKAFSWTPSLVSSKGKTASSASKTGANKVAASTAKTSPAALLEQAIAAKIMTFDKSVNRAPLMAPFNPMTLSGGGTYAGQVLAVDLDGDALTYEVTPYPRGFFLNRKTGAFSWVFGQANQGTQRLVFRVRDGKNMAEQTAVFVIGKPAKPK